MKKIVHIYYIVAALSFGFAFTAYGQKNYLNQIRVENQSATKENNTASVYMDIVLDALTMSTNEMLTLTPVMVANDETRTLELPPVVINGSRRQKMVERAYVLNNGPVFPVNPQTVVKRANNAAQTISYGTGVPYEDWMSSASLKIIGSLTGCAECDKGEDELLIAERIIPQAYVPVYMLTYIVPDAEVKTRSDKHTATINFHVDKHNLVRDYKNNAAVLNEVDRIVSDIVHNNDLTVSDFEIIGYASPEASVAYNKALSERRANTFADYLSNKFNVPRNRMRVSGYGEDWVKTREVIAASNITDKADILRIIDSVSNPDARDAELKKLSNGTTYQTMLRDYYPQIRRTEYTVSYTVRPFNVEEAKQVIKTNPKLLSLNEMYLVAETYPAESKEFKEVFDIATRLYPDDPIAILNSAAADIEGGNHQAALDRLMKIENDPRAWNNLGVAYARMGDLEKAESYFSRAANRGDNDASANLQELEKINR